MTTALINFALSCYELTSYSPDVPINTTVALDDLNNIPISEHGNHDSFRPPITNQTLKSLNPVLNDALEATSNAMPPNAMVRTASSDPDVITSTPYHRVGCGQWDRSAPSMLGDLADLSEVHSDLSYPSLSSFVPSSYHSQSSLGPYVPPIRTLPALDQDIGDQPKHDLSSPLSCPGSKPHNGEGSSLEMLDRVTLDHGAPAMQSLDLPASPGIHDESKFTKGRQTHKEKKWLQVPFVTDRSPPQQDIGYFHNDHNFRLQAREAEINKKSGLEDAGKGTYGNTPLSSSKPLSERGGESQGNRLPTGPQRGTKRPRDKEPEEPEVVEKNKSENSVTLDDIQHCNFTGGSRWIWRVYSPPGGNPGGPSRVREQSTLSPPRKRARPAGDSVTQDKVWSFVHYPSPDTDSGKQFKRKRT